MSYAAPDKPEWETPAPKPKGSGLKWVLLGCGGLFLVGLLLCGGAAVFGVRWGMQQVAQLTEEFEVQGYEKQMGQMIQVGQSPAKKTVYVCQSLKITQDVDVDIAAVCQLMEVEANIHGDVDFIGQLLKVNSGCVIDGDLRIKNGQNIEINGDVKGKVTGNYMVLTYKGKSFGPGQSPTAEMEPDAPQAPDSPAPLTPEAPTPAPPTPAPPAPPAPAAAPATPST